MQLSFYVAVSVPLLLFDVGEVGLCDFSPASNSFHPRLSSFVIDPSCFVFHSVCFLLSCVCVVRLLFLCLGPERFDVCLRIVWLGVRCGNFLPESKTGVLFVLFWFSSCLWLRLFLCGLSFSSVIMLSSSSLSSAKHALDQRMIRGGNAIFFYLLLLGYHCKFHRTLFFLILLVLDSR